jgi:hypothetical protein
MDPRTHRYRRMRDTVRHLQNEGRETLMLLEAGFRPGEILEFFEARDAAFGPCIYAPELSKNADEDGPQFQVPGDA